MNNRVRGLTQIRKRSNKKVARRWLAVTKIQNHYRCISVDDCHPAEFMISVVIKNHLGPVDSTIPS